MSEFGPDDMFRYGIVDVCQRLHGDVKGTSDGLPYDEFRALVRWLDWRVRYAWSNYPYGNPYDDAVRRLAFVTLALCASRESAE